MNNYKNALVALAVSGLVASCFSGSSSQGTTPRKAAKRLGGSSSSTETAPAQAAETPAQPSDATATSASSQSTAGGEQTLRTLYVNVTSANVRSMPSKEATVVAKLKFLDPVGATGALDGEWVQVEVTMSDGAIGKAWIHSTLVSASKEQAEAVKAAAGGR
jgi:hypothetical protein